MMSEIKKMLIKPKLKAGDVLYINRGLYKHYGVYIGGEKVIHFAPLEGAEINAKNAVIHEIDLKSFLRGGTPEVDKKLKAKFDRKKIVERARSQIGSKGYNLVFGNCEHFAQWCKTGSHESNQVNDAVEIVTEGVIHAINVFQGKADVNDGKRILSKLQKFFK